MNYGRSINYTECIFRARERFLTGLSHCKDLALCFDENGLIVFDIARLRGFPHQVAGHTNEDDSGMTYQGLSPRHFFPRYFGAMIAGSTALHPLPFLCLEDLTVGYTRPCVMDIKMGRQVFNNITRQYKRVDKRLGRSLTPTSVQLGLAAFFFDGKALRKDVISALILRLSPLLTWMRMQNKFHFYCSSLLIIYEGVPGAEVTHEGVPGAEVTHEGVPGSLGKREDYLRVAEIDDVRLDMRIIDLAHVVESMDGQPDWGYMYGLENLISTLRKILETHETDLSELGRQVEALLDRF